MSPTNTLTCGHPNAGMRGPNGECMIIVTRADARVFCGGAQR